MVFTCYEGLYNYVVYARPQKVHVDAYIVEMLAKCSEAPLVAKVVVLCSLILDELVVFLIDAIVCQVAVFVRLVCGVVSLCGEACKPLFENIYSQWLDARDEHINTQVELVRIYK